jgi:regulator of RNase E activity RraA
MKNLQASILLLGSLALLLAPVRGWGQLGIWSRESRQEFTREWKGERFPDGRPKISDQLLARMKNVKAEIAWGVMREAGYRFQFEGGWKVIHPEERLVGRVVTAVFLPLRPDVQAVINDFGKKEERIGPQNSWVIDTLVKDDVLVVDMFGKIKDGPFAGDNLATSIFTKTGTGFVVNGAVRDVGGIADIKGIKVYVRDFHPSAIHEVTLMGINVPIRIGEVTVMPGDIVLSDPEGLTFIPPHLAEKIADASELAQMQDLWSHEMLRQKRYTPGQIDSQWTAEMIQEFNRWAEKRGAKVRMKVE